MDDVLAALVRKVELVDGHQLPRPKDHKGEWWEKGPDMYRIKLELRHPNKSVAMTNHSSDSSDLYLMYAEVPAWAVPGRTIRWKMQAE